MVLVFPSDILELSLACYLKRRERFNDWKLVECFDTLKERHLSNINRSYPGTAAIRTQLRSNSKGLGRWLSG